MSLPSFSHEHPDEDLFSPGSSTGPTNFPSRAIGSAESSQDEDYNLLRYGGDSTPVPFFDRTTHPPLPTDIGPHIPNQHLYVNRAESHEKSSGWTYISDIPNDLRQTGWIGYRPLDVTGDNEQEASAVARALVGSMDNNFAIEFERDQHDYRCGGNCVGQFVGSHECLRGRQALSIVCSGGDCQSIFRTRAGFNRHWNSRHLYPRLQEKKKFDCPFDGCRRIGRHGFKRPDNLRQHRRNVHGENIPKEKRMFTDDT